MSDDLAENAKPEPDSKKPTTNKSVFDERFKYLVIPAEILQHTYRVRCYGNGDGSKKRLTPPEMMIFTRILYWTRKRMPCSQTNQQFAEMVGVTERTAKRAIANLIRQGLVKGWYRNSGKTHQKGAYRDLMAMQYVDLPEIVARTVAQERHRKSSGQNDPMGKAHRDKLSRSSGQNDPMDRGSSGQIFPSTTNSYNKEQIGASTRLGKGRNSTPLTDEETTHRREELLQQVEQMKKAPPGGVKKLQT